jgi:hypothetical protein
MLKAAAMLCSNSEKVEKLGRFAAPAGQLAAKLAAVASPILFAY